MVDEIQGLVPVEQVGVARGAVDIGVKGVEPDGGRGSGRTGAPAADRTSPIPGKIERQVQPGTGLEQRPDLVIRLVRPSAGSTSISTSSGTFSPSARPISPATISATRASGPCPAPRKLTRTSRGRLLPLSREGPPSRNGVTYRVAKRAQHRTPSLAVSRLKLHTGPTYFLTETEYHREDFLHTHGSVDAGSEIATTSARTLYTLASGRGLPAAGSGRGPAGARPGGRSAGACFCASSSPWPRPTPG